MVYNNPDNYWHQRYNIKPTNKYGCFYSLFGIIIIAIISLLLSSCKTQYVPVETVRTEYINKTDTFIQRDSICIVDSVFVEKNGDTTIIQKTKIVYKDRWQFKCAKDTIIKTDSIRVPYPVERRLSKWEETKMDMGGIAISVLVVFLVIMLLKWLTKIKCRF